VPLEFKKPQRCLSAASSARSKATPALNCGKKLIAGFCRGRAPAAARASATLASSARSIIGQTVTGLPGGRAGDPFAQVVGAALVVHNHEVPAVDARQLESIFVEGGGEALAVVGTIPAFADGLADFLEVGAQAA
jgi:hypothetical protein